MHFFSPVSRVATVLLSTALVSGAAWSQSAQERTRNPPPEAPGTATGELVVSVESEEDAAPLRGATIRLSSTSDGAARLFATDEQGVATVGRLAPGYYSVSALKAGFVAKGSPPVGTPRIEVRAGRASRVTIRMRRGGVIHGRVVDQRGEPVPGVRLSAQRFTGLGAERRLLTVGQSAEANDRGDYRIYGLPTGRYYVTAMRRPGQALGPIGPNAEALGFSPTFYPGATRMDEARRLEVSAGQEIVADIRLDEKPLLTVNGIVRDGSGRPVSGGLARATLRGAPGSAPIGTSPIRPNGAFTFSGMPSGSYELHAWREARLEGGATEYGRIDLALTDSSVGDVVITTTSATPVRGRVVVDGDSEPAPLAGIQLFAVSEWAGSQRPHAGTGVAVDGTFSFRETVGPTHFAASCPPGWMLKRISLGSRDITNAAVDFGHVRSELVTVIVTRQVASVRGTALDGSGHAVSDVRMILLPRQSLNENRIAQARLSAVQENGSFEFAAVPPGDYVLAPTIGDEDDGDAELLDRLRESGFAVAVKDGQSVTSQVTVRRGLDTP